MGTQQTSSFNSLMVRLKAFPEAIAKAKSRCFNSLMVRLKDAAATMLLSRNIQFQFLDGAIKSKIIKRCCRFAWHVSIP